MTDAPATATTKLVLRASSGGVDWQLELERVLLLPGTLVRGHLALRATHDIDARGLVVALIATEHWRHRESSTDGQGNTTTRVVTSRADVIHEPVQLRGELHLGAGESLDLAFELPVPPVGPATLEAEDAGLDWTVEAKLDVPGGFDSGLEGRVVVAQPTALLMAGAVPVGEFSLYPAADVAADGSSGSVELQPMPLVCGAPFNGVVRFHAPPGTRVRGVRAEIRVHVEATVSQGESSDLTLWTGVLGVPGVAAEEDLAGDREFPIAGTLPATPIPSIELPHGRTRASFHVILDRPWAIDTHLSRDVAIATTSEI